jgi:hypothetical protein
MDPDGLTTLGKPRGIGEPDRGGGKEGSSELYSSEDSGFLGVFWNSVRVPSCSSSFQRTDLFGGFACDFFGVKLTLFRPAAALRRRGEPLVGEGGTTGANVTGGSAVDTGGKLTKLNLFFGFMGLEGLA